MAKPYKKFCEGCRSVRPASEFLKPTSKTVQAPELCRTCRRRDAHDKIIGRPFQTLESAVSQYKDYQNAISQVKKQRDAAIARCDDEVRELEGYQAAVTETVNQVVAAHDIKIGVLGILCAGGRIIKSGSRIGIKIDERGCLEKEETLRRECRRLYHKALYKGKKPIKTGVKQP